MEGKFPKIDEETYRKIVSKIWDGNQETPAWESETINGVKYDGVKLRDLNTNTILLYENHHSSPPTFEVHKDYVDYYDRD